MARIFWYHDSRKGIAQTQAQTGRLQPIRAYKSSQASTSGRDRDCSECGSAWSVNTRCNVSHRRRRPGYRRGSPRLCRRRRPPRRFHPTVRVRRLRQRPCHSPTSASTYRGTDRGAHWEAHGGAAAQKVTTTAAVRLPTDGVLQTKRRRVPSSAAAPPTSRNRGAELPHVAPTTAPPVIAPAPDRGAGGPDSAAEFVPSSAPPAALGPTDSQPSYVPSSAPTAPGANDHRQVTPSSAPTPAPWAPTTPPLPSSALTAAQPTDSAAELLAIGGRPRRQQSQGRRTSRPSLPPYVLRQPHVPRDPRRRPETAAPSSSRVPTTAMGLRTVEIAHSLAHDVANAPPAMDPRRRQSRHRRRPRRRATGGSPRPGRRPTNRRARRQGRHGQGRRTSRRRARRRLTCPTRAANQTNGAPGSATVPSRRRRRGLHADVPADAAAIAVAVRVPLGPRSARRRLLQFRRPRLRRRRSAIASRRPYPLRSQPPNLSGAGRADATAKRVPSAAPTPERARCGSPAPTALPTVSLYPLCRRKLRGRSHGRDATSERCRRWLQAPERGAYASSTAQPDGRAVAGPSPAPRQCRRPARLAANRRPTRCALGCASAHADAPRRRARSQRGADAAPSPGR